MGGKLLKLFNLPEKRLSRINYENLKTRLLEILNRDFTCRVAVPPSYREKESFGDIDVLCEDKKMDWRTLIKDSFGYTPHRNTSVYSFPFEDFQVDLILAPPSEFDTTLNYLSFNDLSNLIGRIVHKFGLCFSHKGLKYFIREELFADNWENETSQICKEVILDRSMASILPLFDFDFEKWQRGFDNLEDIYNFITKSKYFNAEIFKYENLNSINRKRDSRRPTYQNFVKWCEEKFQNVEGFKFKEKKDYLPLWIERYPHLKEEIEKCRQEYFNKKLEKDKFNGNLVRDWTGITDGPVIGVIVKAVKSRTDLMAGDQEEIKKFVLEFVKNI